MTKRPPDRSSAVSSTRTDLARRGERRYAKGERRTDAEPLTASWRPGVESSAVRRAAGGRAGSRSGGRSSAGRSGGRSGSRSGGGRKRRTGYGWRIYAIPVLVVLTVLVVLNTVRNGSPLSLLESGADATDAGQDGQPAATEGSATAVNVTGGTAVLPAGGAYPQAGAGTWRVLPGSGPVLGRPGARVYHYQIAVEDGVDPAVYAGDDAFVSTVTTILADPRSWIGSGTIALQRVDGGYQDPDFTIALTTPNTDHRPDLCGFQIQFEGSCWVMGEKKVVINVARWVRGALAFNGDLGEYRQYAINHEVGHVFGNHHVGCATDGGLAPVMMEQTFGVADDYVYDVNNTEPANRGAVQRDGKTCLPNPWPFPQGGPYTPPSTANNPTG